MMKTMADVFVALAEVPTPRSGNDTRGISSLVAKVFSAWAAEYY
jgi:hypothetical protein